MDQLTSLDLLYLQEVENVSMITMHYYFILIILITPMKASFLSSLVAPCGQLVFNATSTVQYLTSPGYPANYENNVRCRWRINGARSSDEVDITFIDVDIEAAPDCAKDRLEISDVSSTVRETLYTQVEMSNQYKL